jgi:tagatose-1,6-bisphosphate aldolase non-catalytic subunit AgaZ/GatZ
VLRELVEDQGHPESRPLIHRRLRPRPDQAEWRQAHRGRPIEVIERRMSPIQRIGRITPGDPLAQRTARRYSYSDRSLLLGGRPDRGCPAALLTNLDRIGIPLPLISRSYPHSTTEPQRSAELRAGACHRPGA